MVLNDALKKHRSCLLECEEKHEFCAYDPRRDQDCEALKDACKIVCDFDYSPN